MYYQDLEPGDLVEIVETGPFTRTVYIARLKSVQGNSVCLTRENSRGSNINDIGQNLRVLRYLNDKGYFKSVWKPIEFKGDDITFVKLSGEFEVQKLPSLTIDSDVLLCPYTSDISTMSSCVSLHLDHAIVVSSVVMNVGDMVCLEFILEGVEELLVECVVKSAGEYREDFTYTLVFNNLHIDFKRQILEYILLGGVTANRKEVVFE
jgi:hypothetical protein